MSKRGIKRNHAADATQLRRSHPASHTYKEGPSSIVNGRATQKAYKERHQGPHVSLPEKDKEERRPGGAGRPPGSAEPGRPPVQVHFEEESPPSLLITFHTCIWREPTSTSINRAPSHPSQHTHTLHSILSKKALLSLALLAR